MILSYEPTYSTERSTSSSDLDSYWYVRVYFRDLDSYRYVVTVHLRRFKNAIRMYVRMDFFRDLDSYRCVGTVHFRRFKNAIRMYVRMDFRRFNFVVNVVLAVVLSQLSNINHSRGF